MAPPNESSAAAAQNRMKTLTMTDEAIEMSMVGKTYLERGNPVIVLVRWGKGGGPRNVLIERADGTRVVRPFRGLRKLAK
jgi:hypothetical protein